MSIELRKRNKGMMYRARFKLSNAPFKSPWFPSKHEAEIWESRTRVDHNDGQVTTGAEVPLEEFAKKWLNEHSFVNKVYQSALRDQHALQHIVPKLAKVKLRSITPAQLEFAFNDLKRARKLRPKTINNYIGTVKKMFNDAVTWGYLSRSPASNLKRVKANTDEVRVFTDTEVTSILSFQKRTNPRYYEFYVFALNTGCRLGEIAALSWDKVDLELGFATITSTFDTKKKEVAQRTKGKRFRKVPLNKDCVGLLRQMILEGRSRESSLVFAGVDAEYISHEKFRRDLKLIGLNTALEQRKTFHCFRHTFASEFMRRGGDLYQLQKVLGHSSITQTEKYAHFSPDYLKNATDRVSFSAPSSVVVSMVASK